MGQWYAVPVAFCLPSVFTSLCTYSFDSCFPFTHPLDYVNHLFVTVLSITPCCSFIQFDSVFNVYLSLPKCFSKYFLFETFPVSPFQKQHYTSEHVQNLLITHKLICSFPSIVQKKFFSGHNFGISVILALSVCYQTGYENMGLLQSREIFCAGQRQPSHQQRGLIGVVVEVKPSTLYPVVKLMPQTCLLSIVVRVGQG